MCFSLLFSFVFHFYLSVALVANQRCFDVCFEIVTNWNATKFFLDSRVSSCCARFVVSNVKNNYLRHDKWATFIESCYMNLSLLKSVMALQLFF